MKVVLDAIRRIIMQLLVGLAITGLSIFGLLTVHTIWQGAFIQHGIGGAVVVLAVLAYVGWRVGGWANR